MLQLFNRILFFTNALFEFFQFLIAVFFLEDLFLETVVLILIELGEQRVLDRKSVV